MIEVEKKFILSDSNREKLVDKAEFLGTKTFTDSYFDTKSYFLTKRDIWLRKREGQWEMKIPLNDLSEQRVSDQYQELENEKEIAEYLELATEEPLEDVLAKEGYISFVTLVTTRSKYKKDGFSIDIDEIDFGYSVAEIELMVESITDMQEATEKIVDYAVKLGLTTDQPVRGKVAEYLRRNDQAHFEALPH